MDKRSETVKYDWYQTRTTAVITIIAKKVKKENASIHLSSNSVRVYLLLPNGDIYDKDFKLAYKIKPDESSYLVTPTTVEIKLTKNDDLYWESIEHKPGNLLDWSAVECGMKGQNDDEEEFYPETLLQLLEDVYCKGDEDVKRSMKTSIAESGGTILSTDWNSIQMRRVNKPQPPERMEWRSWNS